MKKLFSIFLLFPFQPTVCALHHGINKKACSDFLRKGFFLFPENPRELPQLLHPFASGYFYPFFKRYLVFLS